ncbi:32685_t:CDS:2, partial [Gigaspora margarita]
MVNAFVVREQEASDVILQITLEHLTSIRQNCNSNGKVTTKLIKARYAKLFRLSKKVVGLVLKAGLSKKLSGVLNTFLHEAQDKIIASQKYDEDDESDKSNNSD